MERRSFLKMSAAMSAAATVTACSSDDPAAPELPEIPQVPEKPISEESVSWSSCLVNCGSNCPVKVVTKDGVIVRIDADDNDGVDDYANGQHQVRACLRGRSLKQRTYAPDRIKGPLKRRANAKRGEADFEEISWEQAFQEIADKVQELRGEYGPRSIYNHYGSGAYYGFHSKNCITKALAISGGYLRSYSNYSWAQINAATPATFGESTQSGSYLSELAYSDLFIGFGFNPFEIRMSGSGEQIDFLKAVENNKDLKIVQVDPRYTDSMLGKESTWLPIRPGTDGALAEAICYEMISSGWVERNSKAWIDSHVVGYDRDSLVAEKQKQADAGNTENADAIDVTENFKDYILREGKFAGDVVHTAAWAAGICGIPESQIKALATDLMNAKAPYISVGAGTNRHACGEQTVRSLFMLPILTGKIGLPGTSNGGLPKNYGRGTGSFSGGSNPESAAISFYTWTDAIERGAEFTAEADGVTGLGEDETELGTNMKAIFNINGNALINQHSDVNNTRRILEDTSKCELIVVCDCWMTPSAKFADYILPDTTWLETDDLAGDSYASGMMGYITFLKAAIDPLYDCKNMYEIGLGLAKALGVEGEFTDGKTEQEWLEGAYQTTVSRNPDIALPTTYKEAQELGFVRAMAPDRHIAMEDFAKDPVANPQSRTPSGKIEIYSIDWAKKAKTLTPRSDADYDQITALPKYTAAWQGFEDEETKHDYPFQVAEYHTKGRTHSSYHNVKWLRESVEDAVWVNPLDASKHGFVSGQKVVMESPQGAIRVRVKITERVIPGVVAMAQGAWYTGADTAGDGSGSVGAAGAVDEGGCSNTLTKYHPTPVSKGNPQHTIRVRLTA